MTERIAVIAWGAMADTVYAIPIVRHIRSLHPEAHIVWLVRDKFRDVIDTCPYINQVLPFTLPEGFATRQDAEHQMDAQILAFAKKYDKVYDLQYWPRYTNFYERIGEDFLSLRARNAGLNPKDITNRNIEIPLTRDDTDEIMAFLEPHRECLQDRGFVTMNHISYAASPVWPLENYSLLVDKLRENNIVTLATGASNESLPDGAVDARGLSFRAWYGLISLSCYWVGLDSGAKALAAATSVPMLVLHSSDFPMSKTGCQAMGIRKDKILELCPAPSVDTVLDLMMGQLQ